MKPKKTKTVKTTTQPKPLQPYQKVQLENPTAFNKKGKGNKYYGTLDNAISDAEKYDMGMDATRNIMGVGKRKKR